MAMAIVTAKATATALAMAAMVGATETKLICVYT